MKLFWKLIPISNSKFILVVYQLLSQVFNIITILRGNFMWSLLCMLSRHNHNLNHRTHSLTFHRYHYKPKLCSANACHHPTKIVNKFYGLLKINCSKHAHFTFPMSLTRFKFSGMGWSPKLCNMVGCGLLSCLILWFSWSHV